MFHQPLPKKPTTNIQQQQLQNQGYIHSLPSPFHASQNNLEALQTPIKNRKEQVLQTPKTLPAYYFQNMSLTTPQSATPESPKKSASSKKCTTIPMCGKNRRSSPSEVLLKNLFDENVPPSSFDIFVDSEADLNTSQDSSKKRKRNSDPGQLSYKSNSDSEAMDTNSDEESPVVDHIVSQFQNTVNVYSNNFQESSFGQNTMPSQVVSQTPLYTLTHSPMLESSLKRMKML